jgi:hypothetical protein
LTPDLYLLRVDARGQGHTGPQESTKSLKFTVTPIPPPPPPTFQQIYDRYFAPSPASTPGHCNNCHASAPASSFFSPGTTKSTFYQALVNGGFINTSNPSASTLGSSSSSPLIWINPNGIMPLDNETANAAAQQDILAWIAAGAQNN